MEAFVNGIVSGILYWFACGVIAALILTAIEIFDPKGRVSRFDWRGLIIIIFAGPLLVVALTYGVCNYVINKIGDEKK